MRRGGESQPKRFAQERSPTLIWHRGGGRSPSFSEWKRVFWRYCGYYCHTERAVTGEGGEEQRVRVKGSEGAGEDQGEGEGERVEGAGEG